VAAAQIAFAGDCGMKIVLSQVPTNEPMKPEKIMYSESASRFLITVPARFKQEFERTMAGDIFAEIGFATPGQDLAIIYNDKVILRENVDKLKNSWKKPFNNY